MRVFVLPRRIAEHYTRQTPWAHIAITDPASRDLAPPRCPRLRERLSLHFMDVTPEDFERNPAFARFEPALFNSDQAGQIIAFLATHQNAELDWVVSCEAGISRSSAVANFALDYFALAQGRFSPPRYQPNPHVISLLRTTAKAQNRAPQRSKIPPL